MIGYIIIGVFAVIVLYIVALYFVNSRKIKKKNAQKTEKVEKEKEKPVDKNEKVEVQSEITTGSPLEKAINEANNYSNKTEIEIAFQKMEEQRQAYEKSNVKSITSRGLKKDRSNFKTELQIAIENNNVAISSDTNIIGKEGPSQEQIDRTNQAIAKEHESEKPMSHEKIASEISKMSPEAKAILINDILGKKY